MRQIFAFIFLLIILSSCGIPTNEEKLNLNIHSDTTLVLSKNKNLEFVSGFELIIKGKFEEKIIVTQTNGNNVAYKHQLVGLVDTTFLGDWYADTCWIKFEKINKPIKDLEIRYTFY